MDKSVLDEVKKFGKAILLAVLLLVVFVLYFLTSSKSLFNVFILLFLALVYFVIDIFWPKKSLSYVLQLLFGFSIVQYFFDKENFYGYLALISGIGLAAIYFYKQANNPNKTTAQPESIHSRLKSPAYEKNGLLAGLKKKFFTKTVLTALVLVIALAAYVVTKFVFFAYIVFLSMLALVALDFLSPSQKKQSLKESAVEIGTSIALALGAWFLLGFLLSTSTPLNVVTSCSMLPVLDRGDLIILQGTRVSAPEVRVGQPLGSAASQLAELIDSSGRFTSRVYMPYVNGAPLFTPVVSSCTRVYRDGNTESIQCVKEARFNNVGQAVSIDYSNDIIVYDPAPAPYGLIIHRAFAKLIASDGVYYLTKGDNNQVPDQLSGIGLVAENKVQGRVLLRVPYVGFLKLFLFFQFDEPKGCDYVTS